MSRTRGWAFTLNNYTDDEKEHIKNIKCNYLIFGEEVGESGTPHLQGYILFTNAKTMSAAKKTISKRCHIEKAIASAEKNKEYCSKDGTIFEKGDCPKQGERNDLEKLRNKILDDELTVNDIIMENPMMYHQYGRTLNKIEDLKLRQNQRKEMTKGIWYWGPTGVGKSHKAFENYSPDTHYNVPDDGDWWDAYTQQDTVILNDFRGSISYNTMLQMVDKWPYAVRRRNREPMPFTSKLVIVTSSLKPEEVYNRRDDEDKIEQLLRRFEVIQLSQNYT